MPAQDEIPNPASDQISYVVARLDRALRRGIGVLLDEHGLTMPEYTALAVLADGPGMSNAQLSRRLFVSPQGSHQLLGELERRGLLRRTPHPTNKRVVLTELTPAGQRLLESCRTGVEQIEARMTARLSAADRRRLLPLLQTCAETIAGGFFGEPDPSRARARGAIRAR